MKKLLLSSSLLLSTTFISAQSNFSDDFESYTSGDFVAQKSSKWETWSGPNGGGTDDVKVVNNKAKSGNNSIYFSSTAASGGPSDLVLPFGGQYNNGNFCLNMNMFIETGKSAYFNFQEQTTVGKGYCIDVYFETNGKITINNNRTGLSFTCKYTQNQWINFEIKAYLNSNKWEVLLDGVSQGEFQNGSYQIASMDIFPLNGSSYWIDDIAYTYTPESGPYSTDGALTYIDGMIGYLGGAKVYPTFEIRNMGNNAITSADISVTYGNYVKLVSYTGLNIAKGATANVVWTDLLSIYPTKTTFTAQIVSINGNADDNSNDDTKSLILDPIVPAQYKLVIGEEATGTWCSWCPRGAVALRNMDKMYHGYFQGIAVHNNDPMSNSFYDAGLATISSGYPSGLVDRGSDIDPSVMGGDFITRITVAPNGRMEAAAKIENNTDLLVSLKTTILNDISGNYKLACVLVEDSVTGTTAGYNQNNAYAGGSNGTMGGFESLTNPVPASKMIYDHVGRAISPGFSGMANAFGTTMKSGDTFVHNFKFTIDPTWKLNKLHIVGLFIAPTGKIDNGSVASYNEAKTLPYLTGQTVLNASEITKNLAKIYPIPTQQNLNISMANPNDVLVKIYNLQGQVVIEKTLSGSLNYNISVEHLSNGVYSVELDQNGAKQAQTIVKQ